ncbi:hypothetical protein [Nocardia pseudovaccinii]|nr:hypothetical protein [Nocardia pseudovaccinii]
MVAVVDIVVVTMVEIVEEIPDLVSMHGTAELVTAVVTVGQTGTLAPQG